MNSRTGNTLTLRLDVLPVNNKRMFSLMKYSLDDILLTGDQSITDCLSCCSKKNIFYQIASWKEGFAKELAKEMPNAYLKSKKTSCGSLKAISYRSNYSKFVKKWDFRILAKPKLDAIMMYAVNKTDIKPRKKSRRSTKKKPRRSTKKKSRRSTKKKPRRSTKKKPRRSTKKKPRRSTKKKPRRSTKKKSRRSTKKKSRKSVCRYGVNKNGGCKKKPGPKNRTTKK